jgi:Tfp pilus assembly protein PilX
MKHKLYKTDKGAAMLIVVLFFVFISLTLLVGIVTPVVREFRISSANLESKQAYFLSESGVEDALYRVKNNKQIGSSETLVLGTSSATTAITNLSGGQKDITTVGTDDSHQRKVDLVLSTASGVSFNYGVQVGQGGIDLSGSGTVTGNVYSNGPITGDSSAIITGSAISANSPSLSADQSNGTGTPAYNISFGNASATQDIAQSFQLATSSPLNKVQLYIKKTGSPSNATVKIVNDSSGTPGTTVLATGTLSAASVTTSYGWIDVSLTTNPTLAVGTTYWIVVDAGTSSSNYYILGANSAGYANGAGKIGQFSGTWNNTTPTGLDYYFNIYLGGVYGSIAGSSGSQYNQLHIGTVSGIAQAHTVNYTNVTGTLTCQSGTGNNKTCTSGTDPTYIAFPVSDANITDWQTTAAAGGTSTGNYSVGYAGATLGPKKIVGNLDVSSGGILTVTGVLWVTGNLTLNGGATIQLASGYGANDGVIMVDGTITISGGGHATGSGTTGSYIMMVTTSSSGSAASISGGAGAVIVYAPNGTVTISGGASLKEVTAYKMVIDGGSNVTYETGLANNNFTSGASGTWNIASWKETQ